MSTIINIEFVSDVSCPWCAVGYNEFINAVKQLDDQVVVNFSWLPFEINPDMRMEGQDVRSYLLSKYGMNESDQLQNMAQIETRGKAAGFEFKPMIDRHVYNSFDCHCLLEVARVRGLQTDLKQQLFAAYFQQSVDISHRNSLRVIAKKVGLNELDIAQAFDDESLRQSVHHEMDKIKEAGVTSVPTLVINSKYFIAGAQGEAGYLGLIKQVI
jgi:predicted DsbA family dithiol-disulfide isomerase